MIDHPPVRHPLTPLKVVLLSGLSNPQSCALSPAQTGFLAALDVAEEAKVYWNFPYVPGEAWRTTPLWLASWRNYRQYRLASRDAYRLNAQRHWRALVRSTERLVVITLSCGIEIVNQCVDIDDTRRDIHIIALGPVAHARPTLPHTLVQGSRDSISKFFFNDADVVIDGVGHMDYLGDRQVAELCNNISRSSAADSICRSAG